MDIHIAPGVKAIDVAAAHQLDLAHQDHHGCKFMTYWVDEERESVFCLIDAPDKESVHEVHRKAHGLIPNKIIEVKSSVVESFLGRIYDPSDADINEEGLKVFIDPSFRVLMVTSIADPIILRNRIGHENANTVVERINAAVRKFVLRFEGRETEHDGSGFIISFCSASQAVTCAARIQQEITEADAKAAAFRIVLNGGEPIEKSNKLFGDVIQAAKNISTIAKKGQVVMTSAVKNLVSKDVNNGAHRDFHHLTPQDEDFINQLFTRLEENWQNADFDVDDYCRVMAMSRSQLYRKSIQLTGMSPNILLKEYRLEAAKEMMRKQRMNISQVTFNSGFTSPSYFTKCFRKTYGMLPMAYVDLLH
jgi:AraC-like DNA-binding protein